jgi:hypothetical protein
MPNWKELLEEVKAAGSTHDVIRRKYLQQLHQLTGRNLIIYYSAWLQKGELQRQGIGGFSISDADKNGFMTAIHGMDPRSNGCRIDLLSGCSLMNECADKFRFHISPIYSLNAILNLNLSILRVRIRDSKVVRGMPSFAAAPDGPATRPQLS